MRVPGIHGRVFSLLVAASLFASCGGSNNSTGPSSNELYYKFKANGTLIEFTNAASLWATFNTTSGQNTLIISGFDANSNSNLQVYRDQEITTGTYSGFAAGNGALNGVLIGYQDASGVDYVDDGTTAADATITITSITSTRVSGTFFGILKSSGHPDVTVTEGQFVVQRTS